MRLWRNHGRLEASAREERGQTLVEYALIIAVVSLGSLVALGFLSGKIQALFSKAGSSIENVTVASGGSGSGSGGGTPPPVPTLTGGPAQGTSGSSATYTNPSFSFTSAGATGFQCSIDGGTFGSCTSPTSMGPGLAAGAHSFAVQASSGGGTSAPATRSWTVSVSVPAGGSVSITCLGGGGCSDGDTLRATTSGWSNSPTSYTYQWQRTGTNGNDCVGGFSNYGSAVTSASTTNDLTTQSTSNDYCYRVQVYATNGGGNSVTVTSNEIEAQ